MAQSVTFLLLGSETSNIMGKCDFFMGLVPNCTRPRASDSDVVIVVLFLLLTY